MKLSLFTTATLALSSFANALLVTPTSEEFEISKRLDVESLASTLLEGHLVSDVISEINYEKIAGYAEDLLTEDNHEQYLVSLLKKLSNSEIIPKLAVKLVTSNKTLKVLEESLPVLLAVGKNIDVNVTTLLEALDRSGLGYQIIAGTVSNSEFLPSLLSIAKKFIKSGALNLTKILDESGELFEEELSTRQLALDYVPEESVYDLVDFDKRDNVEELLETVFDAIGDSGLINATIVEILANSEFQDAAVVLLQGAFENIGSLVGDAKNFNFSSLEPILKSLKSSGLLNSTLEHLLKDSSLKTALENDLSSLLKNGTIKTTDIVSKKDELSILKKSSATSTESDSSETSASSSTSTSSASSSSDSGATNLVDGSSNSRIVAIVLSVLSLATVVVF